MKLLGKEMYIGKINIYSKTMTITDPCYSPDVWCVGEISDILRGEWTTKILKADDSITNWGDRNTALFAFNSKYFEDKFNFDDIEVERFVSGAYHSQFTLLQEFCFDIGVDSGQAGIYDSKYYLKQKELDQAEDTKDKWYWENCDKTNSKNQAGILSDKKGCVTATGYGDGFYPVYRYLNKDLETVAVLIVFIEEENNIEEEI